MNYSALLVSAAPGRFSEMLRALNALEGAEVHHTDEETGRCIVVIEAPDLEAEMEKFKAISELTPVINTALVAHQFEDSAVIRPIEDVSPLN